MLPTKDILLVLAVLSAGSSLVDGGVHGGGGSEIRKMLQDTGLLKLAQVKGILTVGNQVQGIIL